MLRPATGESFLSELQCLSGVPIGRCISVPLPVQDCTLKEAHSGCADLNCFALHFVLLLYSFSTKPHYDNVFFSPVGWANILLCYTSATPLTEWNFTTGLSRTTNQMSGGHNHPTLPIL